MITCRGRLSKAFARTLAARGYRRLTPVQRAVLRLEADDLDLLVSAGTGSGKTVPFGLMLARRLTGAGGRVPWAAGPQAIVIVPTRELAMQVRGELGWLFAGSGARIGCCTGGSDLRAEQAALGAGLDIIVGTPGRLGAPLRLGVLGTGHVRCVVLDEADQMLGADFRVEIEALLAALPERRQTLMFSATVSAEVEQMARRFQRDAQRLDLGAARGFELQGVAVAGADREAVVVNLLRLHEARAAIVFCARRDSAGSLAGRLAARGFAVAELSGAISQSGRNAALAALREGRVRVCVATDLAARGFDLPGLELVLHAELPGSADILLHRSGRTGRAGRGGLAVLVVTPAERRRAVALAGRAGLRIAWMPAPDRGEIAARDLERMLAEAAGSEPDNEDSEVAARLLAAHGAQRIAVAYRRLWASARPAAGQLKGGR
jgi:ATP-dependent RNA helicase DeaD